MGEAIKKLKESARQIKQELFVLIEAYKHPKVPIYVKLIAILVIGYALSPIDLIPDFIPVLGYLDDIILVPLGISLVLKLIPSDILEECREKVKNSEKVKKKNWFAGFIIICIWISIALWMYNLIF